MKYKFCVFINEKEKIFARLRKEEKEKKDCENLN